MFWIWSVLLCIGVAVIETVNLCAWPRLRRDKGISMKPTSNLSKFFCCLRKDAPEGDELREDMDGGDEKEVVDSMEDLPSQTSMCRELWSRPRPIHFVDVPRVNHDKRCAKRGLGDSATAVGRISDSEGVGLFEY
jgi:hypothetical protein